MPEHKKLFADLLQRLKKTPSIRYSSFGEYMEARLFADMARYRLQNKVWELAEVISSGKKIICGQIAEPVRGRQHYLDKVNLAAKGWQYR